MDVSIYIYNSFNYINILIQSGGCEWILEFMRLGMGEVSPRFTLAACMFQR